MKKKLPVKASAAYNWICPVSDSVGRYFAVWYLKAKGYVTMSDDSDLMLTAVPSGPQAPTAIIKFELSEVRAVCHRDALLFGRPLLTFESASMLSFG